jgi:hypothetical protein
MKYAAYAFTFSSSDRLNYFRDMANRLVISYSREAGSFMSLLFLNAALYCPEKSLTCTRILLPFKGYYKLSWIPLNFQQGSVGREGHNIRIDNYRRRFCDH